MDHPPTPEYGVVRFTNRREAGRALALRLTDAVRFDTPPLVLALPRGGVPVADEVAAALGGELDVVVVRKLGLPGHGELAMGAIAGGGWRVMNDDVVNRHGVPPAAIDQVVAAEEAELARREARYRGGRPAPVLAGRDVILVDDGLATGATMRAAIAAARSARPARVIVAVPVAPAPTAVALEDEADAVVTVMAPESFFAVGQFYDNFAAPTDDEVAATLASAAR